ncbi:MAG: four helix bundle protein [Bacteroidetes bacterium]|nr:four helix bundle protein [Bacteroidota bacterium]
MAFKFEQLHVWKLALDMADDVHTLTRNFPKEEIFSLTSQMKRAADSISLNIAEGSTGQSNPEQGRFFGYAQRSAIEVVNCLYLAIRRKYIDQKQFDSFYTALEIVIIKIQALKKAIKSK